jgi:hypothetical protein
VLRENQSQMNYPVSYKAELLKTIEYTGGMIVVNSTSAEMNP